MNTALFSKVKRNLIEMYRHFILSTECNSSVVKSIIETIDIHLLSKWSSDSDRWTFRNTYKGISAGGYSKSKIWCVMAYQDQHHPSHPASIALVQQFFMHNDAERYAEFKECLRRNVANPSIRRIFLLNERIYSEGELGIASEKISQVDISKRLTYQGAMLYIRDIKWEGYVVLANCDIFFDDTINSLYNSCLYYEPAWYALLRYEYRGQTDLRECSLGVAPLGDVTLARMGHGRIRPDSQDAWIYHTAHTIPEKHMKHFKFEVGRTGCDGKLIFILNMIKFKAYNEPRKVRIYHYHSGIMNTVFVGLARLKPPYGVCEPNI